MNSFKKSSIFSQKIEIFFGVFYGRFSVFPRLSRVFTAYDCLPFRVCSSVYEHAGKTAFPTRSTDPALPSPSLSPQNTICSVCNNYETQSTEIGVPGSAWKAKLARAEKRRENAACLSENMRKYAIFHIFSGLTRPRGSPAFCRFPALPAAPIAAFFVKIQGAFPCFKGKSTGIHLSDLLKNPGGKHENTIKIQFESVKMRFPPVHNPESVSESLTGMPTKISTRCTRVLILCCIFRKG